VAAAALAKLTVARFRLHELADVLGAQMTGGTSQAQRMLIR
jgi:hypothetical protein